MNVSLFRKLLPWLVVARLPPSPVFASSSAVPGCRPNHRCGEVRAKSRESMAVQHHTGHMLAAANTSRDPLQPRLARVSFPPVVAMIA